MKHRIFIAINLPENIKNKLAEYQKKWPELPARWVKKDNLHITVEFLGYLTSEELFELCQKTKRILSEKNSFYVVLNRVIYAPPNEKKSKKMIWVTGEKIKELNIIPHITLARLKTWQFRQMEEEERPNIDEEPVLPDKFRVTSIEIMESRLKKGGPEYTILESIPLKDKDNQ